MPLWSVCRECCQNNLPREHLRSLSPYCHEYHSAWLQVYDDYQASVTTSQGWLPSCNDYKSAITTMVQWLQSCDVCHAEMTTSPRWTNMVQWLQAWDDYHDAMTTSLRWLPCCHDYHADSGVQGRGCRQGFRRIFSFRGRYSVFCYYKWNENWKYEILRIQLCTAIYKGIGTGQYILYIYVKKLFTKGKGFVCIEMYPFGKVQMKFVPTYVMYSMYTEKYLQVSWLACYDILISWYAYPLVVKYLSVLRKMKKNH